MAHHDAAVHHDIGAHSGADAEYAHTPPGAGYEHTDVNVWIIAKFALWLTISALVIHVGIGAMYWMLIEQSADTAAPAYPLATSPEPRLPPPPRLQQFPRNEIYDFRVAEQQRLSTYGWVDRDAGVVHIPIDEAIRLTLERGLPSRPQTGDQPAETRPLVPSDASAGRTLEIRRQ